MATIQQSIDINVPVHSAYEQLTRFGNYPRFMQDVEAVHQLDDTHLHWVAKMSDASMEWDAEITEQLPDRRIAWRSANGPQAGGRVELQPVGRQKARVTLTMEFDRSQVRAPQENNGDAAMAQRMEQDLARLKEYIEAHGPEAAAKGSDGQQACAERQEGGQEREMQAKTQGDKLESVVRKVADREHEPDQPSAQGGADASQAGAGTQSEASLSSSAAAHADDGRFSVAEEQNLDQQSDQARRVGQMPKGGSAAGSPGVDPSGAAAESMKRNTRNHS
jgi:uncharacterized membrane protein